MSENITLSFERGESTLSVRTLDVVDRISTPFRAEILARSLSPDVDLEALVGAGAAVRVACPVLAGMVRAARVWSGICTSARQIRVEPSGMSTYRLVIEPALIRLSRRTNNRLFQHLTLIEMIARLLGEWRIPHVLHVDAARYPKLEVRTQFRETDLAFFHRLLEEGGISYFFDDEGGESQLVITDAPHDGEPRLPVPFLDEPALVAGKALPFVTGLDLSITEQTGTRTLRDYDHRNPGFALFARAGGDDPEDAHYERYDYAIGAFVHERNPPGFTPVADDKAPQRHDLAQGQLLARTQLEAERARRRALSFSTNLLDLSPGMVFSILDHPRHDLSVDHGFLITEYTLHAEVSKEWRVEQRAAPTAVPWRPLAETPKPRIYGMQTAVVVGPPGEEIYVDEFGRVRVQFPWDREGKMNDDSSSWMRVIQGWAGAGYGLINIPRVGQEVLVGFLDGDPDMPVVAGRVFNQTSPVPYKLPENKTVSAWRSASSPGSDGFNEIRFEDAKGRELVYMQSERDMSHLVKNDEMRVVGNNLTSYVRGNHVSAVEGNRTEHVHGSYLENLTGSRSYTVGGSRASTVAGSDSTIVGKMFSVAIGRQTTDPVLAALEGLVHGPFGALFSKTLFGENPIHALLGMVPRTPLGFPLTGVELGPINVLGDLMANPVTGLLELAQRSVKEAPGPPPTEINMIDKKITLTTGGVTLVLHGEDLLVQASGDMKIVAKKNIEIISEEGDVIIQGGPDVHLNPKVKPHQVSCMFAAAEAGSAFISGSTP